MKKLLVIIVSLIPLLVMGMKRVNIGEAVTNKMISCRIHSFENAPDSLICQKGIKMLMTLQNTSSLDLEIVLESGRRFISTDSAFQNLIITRERLLTLKSGQHLEYPLISYCINAKRSSPAHNSYKVGALARGLLLKMANFLGKNNIVSQAAQSSIWVLTDKHAIQSVSGHTKHETRLVRNYLYEITGLPRPPRNIDPLSYPEVSLQGQVNWMMQKPGKVFIEVLDTAGNKMGILVQNRNYQQGKQLYTFHYLNDLLIPGNLYKVRVILVENKAEIGYWQGETATYSLLKGNSFASSPEK